MRKDTLLAVGFIIAAVAELQWATASYKQGDLVAALELFVVGAALLLATSGLLFAQNRAWSVFTGLLIAALGHAAYLITTISLGALLTLAALLAFVGLAVAAWGAREATHDPRMIRWGLAGAVLAGVLWTFLDLRSGDSSFMVGNIFAVIGYATGAFFAGPTSS